MGESERLSIHSLLRLDCVNYIYIKIGPILFIQSMLQVVLQERYVKSRVDRRNLGREGE